MGKPLPVWLGGYNNWTWDLLHANSMLYHCAIAFLCLKHLFVNLWWQELPVPGTQFIFPDSTQHRKLLFVLGNRFQRRECMQTAQLMNRICMKYSFCQKKIFLICGPIWVKPCPARKTCNSFKCNPFGKWCSSHILYSSIWTSGNHCLEL